MIHQLTVCTHIALIYIDLPPSFQIINSEILPNGSYPCKESHFLMLLYLPNALSWITGN